MSVNTNSKYKEDDFTDSDAVDFSQDVCIYFRPWSTHMSPSLLRSLLTPLHIPARQSDWNTRDDHNSVSGSNPGSFMVMMQIPSHQQTMLTSSPKLSGEHWDAFPHIRNWQDHDLSPSLSKAWSERNLLFQFLMISTTIMKFYKYVPTDVRQ